MNEPTYLTSVDIARICRTSPETVRYWRHIGKGPASFKLGRKVLYAAEDVEAWLTSERRAGNDHKAARQEAGPERVGGEGSARTEELGMACHTVANERQQVLGTCLPAADPIPDPVTFASLILAFQQIQEDAITGPEKHKVQLCIDATRRIYRPGSAVDFDDVWCEIADAMGHAGVGDEESVHCDTCLTEGFPCAPVAAVAEAMRKLLARAGVAV